MKGQKQISEQPQTQDTLAIKNASTKPFNIKLLKKKELTDSPCKSYAQMAALSLPKITTEKTWTEVTSSSQRRKATTPSTPKVKLKKRSVIFQ